MAFKLVKRVLFYGMLAGIYLMGYCKGYDDYKHHNYALERAYEQKKEVVLKGLDGMTDKAYHAIKELIKENRGEKK